MARKRRDILQAQILPVITNGWTDISAPVGWSWSLPFTIQQSGNNFRVKPSFTLQGRAGITVSKTYYVDTVNGNDGNTGLSAAQAFQSMNQVNTQGDADRVYILDGSYIKGNTHPYGFGRSMEIIGLGTVYFTSDVFSDLSFSKTGTNYYTSDLSAAQYVAIVYDYANPTARGAPDILSLAADAATCDSTPGTYFREWNGTKKLYVHPFDSRAPDSNIKCCLAVNFRPQEDSTTYYLENINFIGGASIQNASAAGGAKGYFYGCTFTNASVRGADEVIYQGCVLGGASGDGNNIDDLNGVGSNVVEINCTMQDVGSASSDQCSTTHNATNIVRINGHYRYSAGQCIADTGTGQTWMLGTEVDNSSTGIGIYSSVTMWLDSIYVHDQSTNDLQNVVGTTIYHHNCTLTGSNNIGGTYTAY